MIRKLIITLAAVLGSVLPLSQTASATPSCKAWSSGGRGYAQCYNLTGYYFRSLMKCRTLYGDVVYGGKWQTINGGISSTYSACGGIILWVAADWETYNA